MVLRGWCKGVELVVRISELLNNVESIQSSMKLSSWLKVYVDVHVSDPYSSDNRIKSLNAHIVRLRTSEWGLRSWLLMYGGILALV